VRHDDLTEPLGLAQHRAHLGDRGLSLERDQHRLLAPVEEHRPQQPLELLDLHAQTGLRDVAALRREAKAAGVRHGHRVAHLREGDLGEIHG